MPVLLGNFEIVLLFILLLALAIIIILRRKNYILQRNSERQSDSILNNITDGVYRTDMDGNMLWCSPSAIKILKFTSPAVIEEVNVKDFYVNPEERNILLTKLQENGQVTNYKTQLRCKDGTQIAISCNSTYWYDNEGNIGGIEGVFRDITAQEEAKKALTESEEKYRSLVEGASEAIFSVNYAGLYLYMNSIAAQRLGGLPDNFVGKTMWDIFPKQIADSQMNSIREVFDTGIGRSSQTATIIGGKKYRYSTNLQPIKDSTGKISSILGVARDISSMIQTQHDLQSERDFVESLLETANSLIVCMDKYAKITVFNKQIEKLTGYSRDEVIGKSWPEIFLPEDHYHHKIDNFEEWVREHPGDQLEAQIKTKSGELRTILWSNSTLFHPDSDEFTAIAIGLDITDSKKIEQAQIESEARFKESLKYSQAILYRLNLKTNTYDYMSDAVYDITGFTPEEIIAMGADGVNALVHPDDRDIHLNYRYKLIEADKDGLSTHYLESRIKGKNGKYIWSGDNHALIRGSDGEPLYIIGCARDITDRKRIEQTLRQSELLNRKTLDSIDEAIHVIDTDMMMILINETFIKWCEELNIETDIQGKAVFDIFPFLPDKIKEEYQQVIKTGEPLLTEEEIVLGDQVIITETRKIPVIDDGIVSRVVTIIRDITLQRKGEAARIESEARFHEALENSHDILYRLNLKTNRYDYMSSSVYEVTGYTRGEVFAVEADGINTITHPDDLKITGNYRERLIEADQGRDISHTIEYRILHKDGYYIWLGDSHTLIRDSKGEPLYIIGVARDISEQKLTEIRHKARINLLDKLRKADGIDSCLHYGCQAIFEANLFERAVLTMHNNKKEIINIGYIGLDEATINAARNASPPDDEIMAKMTQEQFRISNSYFIPAESGITYVQSERFVPQEDYTGVSYSTWQPGDELFVPIKGIAELFEGWLSVDTPFDRKRPSTDIITLLEETVDIVTQKIREIRAQLILDEKHKALTESEEKYRNLIDSNPDPIVIFQNGKTKFVNLAFVELFGYNLDEINAGKNFLKIVKEDQVEKVLKRIKDRQSGKKLPDIFAVDLVSKNGKEFPCETSVSKIQYQNRPALFITVRNVTERKKMIDALLQSEKFNNAIIKYSPLGVSIRSNTGKLLSANDAWIKIWGHTNEDIKEFKSRKRIELKFDYCDEYLGGWLPALESVYKKGGYLHISDVKVSNPKGRESLWVSQHFYAIKDTSGNVDRVVILTEDITVRKIAEEKIRAINMDKLEQAKRIAGTFAHEIRNALFPAAASLNRLKFNSRIETYNSEDLRKYSTIAERSITKAADITGLISSYAKLDNERMPERVNLDEVLHELLKNNELRLKEKSVQVDISGDNNCLVKSNRRQLLLAFNNLLLNSIDALSETIDKTINIKWSSNGDSQKIFFEDNGSGIPYEYIDRIFEPFFSKKSESGGTGLGLATTKRIIEMYGGTVSVTSEPSDGTKFHIELKNYENDNINNNLE